MKKWIAILLLAVTVFGFSGCILEEVSFHYRDRSSIDGLQLYLNDVADCCFVGEYTITKLDKQQEITIPDEYNGYSIIQLGGYYGRGLPIYFYLRPTDDLVNVPQTNEIQTTSYCYPGKMDIQGKGQIEEMVFTLNIGKNIKTIENVDMDLYLPHLNEDGSTTYYHPVVYINCSEENRYFYSENGKLYDKETGELIPGFAYAQP